MTVNLTLEPAVEARLRQAAAAAGKDVESFVREAVETAITTSTDAAASRDPAEWERQFNEWVASHAGRTGVADDSRESIYEGRGE